MSKVDRFGDPSGLNEITARAASKVSGVHVAVGAGHVQVLTDGDIGAYCDQWGREQAAKRAAAQRGEISNQTQDAVAANLDGITARDAKNK